MLTTIEIDAALPRGKEYRLSDGGSLYIVVRPSGVRSWEFRFKRAGKVIPHVLGIYGTGSGKMGPKAARVERDRLKGLIAAGLDPKTESKINAEEQREKLALKQAVAAERKAAKAQAEVDRARQELTLEVVAKAWVADNQPTWTARHAEQVIQSLTDHVYPVIGDKMIMNVEPPDVLSLLGGMLADGKVETARRVRQRLDAIFEYAGLRHKLPTNPVSVAKREINKRVRAARKAHPEKNFACVPVAEVPQLLRAMRSYVGTPTTRILSVVRGIDRVPDGRGSLRDLG